MAKCKKCLNRVNKGEEIQDGIYTFCSKSCRLEFKREKVRKQNDKIKVRKVKVKEKKSQSISVLKKKLWTLVSEYIRRRDSDANGMGTCCTCGIVKHWKELQAGHYIPSGSSSFHRYNEFNIHIQCYGCNCGKHGNLIEYRPFMINRYGLEFTENLFETRNTLIDLGKVELQEYINLYKEKLDNLQYK